jgi:membrane fusion protein (multidrug efflux system)
VKLISFSSVWRIAILSAVSLLVTAAGCSRSPPAAAPRAPVQVGVFMVQPQRQAILLELPGRTSARLIAEIRPQIGGIVKQRLFEEGAQVKAGQVLYEIDAASYQAAVASAEASVAKSAAAVNSLALIAKRNAELAKIDAISQQQNDESRASLAQAEAEWKMAGAALTTARINLERTRIVAPISGRVDTSSVTPGALVTANQETPLTTVQQLDPLYVDITQSSAELLRLKRELASGALKRGGANEAPIKLMLEDGSTYAHQGRLQFSGVTVNPGTGAVRLRALVPNPEGLLMPGMYVRAVLEAGVVEQALLVPQQGVTRTSSGAASALVVVAGGKVEQRTLTVERAIGSNWQVTSGLATGDQVIVEGVQRVKVGDVVKSVPMAAAGSGGAAGTPPMKAPDGKASAGTAAAKR